MANSPQLQNLIRSLGGGGNMLGGGNMQAPGMMSLYPRNVPQDPYNSSIYGLSLGNMYGFNPMQQGQQQAMQQGQPTYGANPYYQQFMSPTTSLNPYQLQAPIQLPQRPEGGMVNSAAQPAAPTQQIAYSQLPFWMTNSEPTAANPP